MAKVKTITIGTDKFEIDLDETRISADIDKEMDEVASRISWYGSLLGAAKKEEKALDGAYRHWRAEYGESVLTKDPKASEWKVKQAIESQKKFLMFKEAAAQCLNNITTIENHIKALLEKSPNLRSKGARMRGERSSQDMSTPTEERRAQTASRKQKVRDAKNQ